MFKQKLFAFLGICCSANCFGAQLTELETRWLKAAAPVLHYAKTAALPIDVIVQPQARPSDVPMAMGLQDGRCKLVLSLRGNPNAEKNLEQVAPDEQAVLIEAMAAHEIGHCWRQVQGKWHALPSGFTELGDDVDSHGDLAAQAKKIREHRREEGFADMVALAWTKRRHPEQYGKVHAWLEQVRANPEISHSGHDTRVWVRLAKDSAVFVAAATPFDEAGPAWSAGVLEPE
jgi:hypothetical protein